MNIVERLKERVARANKFCQAPSEIDVEAISTIEQLQQQLAEREKEVQRLGQAVIIAYECGHNDTVESNYCDASERLDEIIIEFGNAP